MGLYLLILPAIAIYLYVNLPHEVVCQDCNFQGKVMKSRRGSWGLEIGLWFALILPGLVYSVWRSANQKLHCEDCSSWNVVPASSAETNRLAPLDT